MRGPLDDAIEAQTPTTATRTGELVAVARPPGGKALLRLLQLLESAGYDEVANAAVDAAVSEADRERYRSRANEVTSAPSGAAAGSVRSRRGRRTRGAADNAHRSDLDAGRAAAGEVGRLYLEASRRLGAAGGPGPQWRSIGPWTVPNGQTYGASRVNVAGRISAVAVDPADPTHVLAGAANGGVWESRDRGNSWVPRTDFAATLTTGAIAFDPSDSATVYCGTGEGNWWSWLGAGILRSTDAGATWATLCTDPFVGLGFYALLVDPADAQHLLAATTGGLDVSLDGGLNWTRARTARSWSVEMAAGGAILAACEDGVWESADGGATWNATPLPGAPAGFDRLALAVAPSNPAVAYAWGASGGTPYLWRGVGGTWAPITTPPGVSTNQAWYDWFLAVAPDQDTQIYCGAIEVHRGDLSNTGWSWTNLTNKGATGDSIHPDQHAIAFEPGSPGTIYVGNDGGLYRSPDRGVTWQHCNNGLVITEFEYLAQHPGSSRWLIGGTQDNGTERWSGSAVWEHVADGDGGDCGVNRTNPLTVFHTYYGMSPERSDTGGGFGSWAWLPPPVPAGEGSLFYPPFECSAVGGDTVAIGGDAVYVSRNNATAWLRLAFPTAARSSALSIPHPDHLYVGVTNGSVFHTSWNGSAWSALTALTTPRAGAVVSDLFVDPANMSRIWVTYRTIGGARVVRSDDGGAAWTDCTAGLPELPINAVEVDPANGARVWVAADLGVYQSLDDGASWSEFSNGLPNMFVGDLVFHPHARVLRAGTRNRGVWEIPVDGWMTQPVCGVQWTGNLAANQSQSWFTYGWPSTWHLVWTVMPTSPRPGGPQLAWRVQVERATAEHVTYWITVTNLTPDPVDFEGRYCILSLY